MLDLNSAAFDTKQDTKQACPIVTYALPCGSMEIFEYQLEDETSPFAIWFDGLDPVAAARVTTALARLAGGNISHVKGLGAGVSEVKIDFGPGYISARTAQTS